MPKLFNAGFLGLFALSAIAAEKTPTLKQLATDVSALRAQVEEARKGIADAEAARIALSEIEARLQRLAAEMEQLSGRGATQADWQRELASLEAEMGQLRGRVAELWDRAWREQEEEKALTGPVLRTSDGRFETKFGGMLHFRHEFLREVPSGEDGETARSSFLLRRAKLSNAGHVWSDKLGYYVQFEFTKDTLLDDFWVEYRRLEYAQLRFGQFRVPFDRQRLVSDYKLQFPDRSTASEFFDLERDIGVMLSGSWKNGLVEWHAAVMNGAGELRENDNIDYLYVARLLVSPWGPVALDEGDVKDGPFRLTFGGGIAYNLVPTDIVAREGGDAALADQDGDGETDNVSVYSISAELALRCHGASLQGEYFHRHENPGAAGDDRAFNGTYVQAGYYILPGRLELAARIAWSEPHYYGQTLEQRQGLAEFVTEHAFAATYARFGHNLKLQVEYAHLVEENIGIPGGAATSFDRADHRIRTQLQIAF